MKNAVVLPLLSTLLTLTIEVKTSDLASSNNKFAASIYKVLSKTAKENFLFSPFSLGIALAVAHSGARNETAEEIRSCLSLSDNEEEEVSFKWFLTVLEQSQDYVLHIANKIYIKDDYQVRDEFKKISEEVFKSDLENINFNEKIEAANKMNKWVEENTENKIRDLIDSEILNNKTRTILINALYFKGNWSSPFQKIFTTEENFYTSSDKTVGVDLMHDYDAIYSYYKSTELNAKFLEMSFEGDNVSMVVVLPNKEEGLSFLEEEIDQVLDTTNFTKELVNVALPKIKIENRIDFKEILKSLGVNKAFLDGEADFSRIGGNKGDLFISDVVQKSFLEVDEDGVEAAAATFIIKIFNRHGDPPEEFIADHPFLFYIKVEGFIVFIGRVVNPST